MLPPGSAVGIGMLALPSAYKHGGWFTALMTLLVGLTSSFTAKVRRAALVYLAIFSSG